MIELPEARIITRDLRKEILGKIVVDVLGNFTNHKFTFYYKDPDKYKDQLIGKKVTDIITRNYYIEIELEDYKLIMRDGTNIRFYDNRQGYPEKSKLLLEFNDGSFINVTVAMYGFISVFHKDEDMENIYYNMELDRVGALDEAFTFDYYLSLINEDTKKLSTKAFLATEQRILGIGNGVVQDILFNASTHPKKKMKDLTNHELEKLYSSIRETLVRMINQNGRDTEKDIYGENGNYITKMSKNNVNKPCPICNELIKKEQYLGGSIYYCPKCQEK